MSSQSNVFPNTSDINYPAPNMTVMSTAVREAMRLAATAEAYQTKTSYLPDLHNKFKGLSSDIYDLNVDVRNTALTLSIGLETAVESLKYNEAELPSADEDEKEDIIASSHDEIKKRLASVVSGEAQLNKKMNALREPFDRQPTGEFVQGLTKDIERCAEDIEHKKAALEELAVQRAALNAAIDAMEKTDLATTGQDLIVTVESMLAAGIAIPQVEVVKLALDHAKKVIEDLEEAISFFTVIKARNKIVDTINSTAKSCDEVANEIRLTEARIKLIDTLYLIDDQRIIYLMEAEKVCQSIRLFLNTFSNQKKDAESLSRFLTETADFIKYMADIGRAPTA